jgi:glutamate N-acetyltransferase/amino-acid N-acetyltransferase
LKFSVPGFRAAGIVCGIKASGAPDLAVLVAERPAAAAGVFTRNRFPGHPVTLSRRRVRRGLARAVVVNSGCANVANGARGDRDARRMTAGVARGIGAPASQVLVASTGVIGRPLPIEKIERGIPRALAALAPDGWRRAARAILTTDSRPKLARAAIGGATLLGIAKGAAMVMPDMATMLAFLATDLPAEPAWLDAALREAVADSFNGLSIDGQTSTSDTVVLLASGAAGGAALASGARARAFERALHGVCRELCEALARDGEGVTRVADVVVSGARTAEHARRAARAIANSVLVKTALFGGDPNWGRVLQALGAAGVPFAPRRVSVRIGGSELLRGGEPVGGPRALAAAGRALRGERVEIAVSLGAGREESRVLTTDLSYEYVRLNAEYTT